MKISPDAALAACLFGLAALTGFAQSAAPVLSPVPWPLSTPEAEGIAAKPVAQMLHWMRGSGLGFHSVILVRNGRLAVEEYFPPFRRDSRQDMFSLAKSVLSTLLGIAQAEGRLPLLDRSALAGLPACEPVDPRAGWITVEQLLTMRSGLPFMRAVDMAAAADQVAFALSKPLAAEPGARFLYTSAGPHLLSAVLQEAVGLSARDYAAQRLFAPLGIRNWSWETDGTGVTVGGARLSLTALDCARLGYLYLRKGDWFGTRVLPASWVEEATRTHAKPSGMNRAEDSGYGYLWWVDEQWGGYSAHGAGGQFVFVVPRLDLVAVFTCGLSPQDFPIPWDLMGRYVLPAAER